MSRQNPPLIGDADFVAYDRAGQPISFEQWAGLHGDAEYRRVESWSSADHEVHVSTVWLGLDHGHGRPTPLTFETFVFGGPLDAEVVRYATEADARDGHHDMVARAHASDGES